MIFFYISAFGQSENTHCSTPDPDHENYLGFIMDVPKIKEFEREELRRRATKKYSLSEGRHRLSLSGLSGLPKGIYRIAVVANGRISQTTILK